MLNPRDSYPSREALAPNSDLAFFFSFSLLSNPYGGERGVSAEQLLFPSGCPGGSAILGGPQTQAVLARIAKATNNSHFLKPQVYAFLHSLLMSHKEPRKGGFPIGSIGQRHRGPQRFSDLPQITQ